MDALFLTSLRIVFWMYLLLVLGQSTLQRLYASRNAKLGREQSPEPAPSGGWPSVDVLVPCYNEDPGLLTACCMSILAQRYEGRIAVWLIDDGSSNAAELEPTYRHFERLHDWNVIRHPVNRGKRAAQDSGFVTGTGDLVLTVDSDTVIDPDGVRRLVAAVSSEGVGGATGNVGVWNASVSWLTTLLCTRYRLLCEQERAAQSFHGAVLCCAGPFSLYRRTALAEVWPAYLEQRILGRRCTNGDDNHLTNLVLAAGYRTTYERQAKAFTEVPASIREFTKQQIRWNRTFYRELLWTVPNLWRRQRFYLAWDVTAHLLLPLLLILATAICTSEILLSHGAMYPFIGRLAAMALVHGVSVTVQTRDPAFLTYGALYALLLLPVRLHALVTVLDHSWMTRQLRPRRPRLAD
jgi:cellulose synthase/poly-beta-1,6-N-acetylglucosamine synthase-like glycosyltransferase